VNAIDLRAGEILWKPTLGEGIERSDARRPTNSPPE
jgi:hypothetical protein